MGRFEPDPGSIICGGGEREASSVSLGRVTGELWWQMHVLEIYAAVRSNGLDAIHQERQEAQ